MRDLDGGPFSPQQRLLVEELALAGAPLPVKDLAAACYVTHQTATAQLALLRGSGVVRAQRRGRRSLYELADAGLESVIRLERRDTEALVESFLFMAALGEMRAAGNEVLQLFDQGPEIWRPGLEALFDQGPASSGSRRALGAQLAATLPRMLRGSFSRETTRLWRDLWWEWGGRFPELRPALGALAGAQRLVERGPDELPLLPRADRRVLRWVLAGQEGTG
jgi:ArsR family transcriptional regulator